MVRPGRQLGGKKRAPYMLVAQRRKTAPWRREIVCRTTPNGDLRRQTPGGGPPSPPNKGQCNAVLGRGQNNAVAWIVPLSQSTAWRVA
eukprot:10750344-Lingulodinium_polyedra.AAC.1